MQIRGHPQGENDDSFCLPPEAFDNPDFKRGIKMFLSPEGRAVRVAILHDGNPASAQGISTVDPVKQAVHEAIKGTPLEGSKVGSDRPALLIGKIADRANKSG